MLTARPFTILNFKLLSDGAMRFSVIVHTSLGPLRIHGFRLTPEGVLLSPSMPIGGPRYLPLVTLTPHQRSLLKKLALRAWSKVLPAGSVLPTAAPEPPAAA